MKYIFILISLWIAVPAAYCQKNISGGVYLKGNFQQVIKTDNGETNIVDSIYFVPFSDYEIYLLKKRNSTKGKLISVHTSDFSISLTDKDLKMYKYIEFLRSSPWDSSQVVRIDSVNTNEKLKIILGNAGEEIIHPKQKVSRAIYVGKPVIYLYPEKEQDISIVNDFKGTLINTYPPYKGKWHVIAEPDGTLLNKEDGRKYNYLFWDGDIRLGPDQYSPQNGFYVSRDSTVAFLQDKLAYIGLNQVEINDFITYWMPLLNKNEMNFIHFYINDNLANTSILTVTPAPASSIVLLMGYSGTSKSIKNRLSEQILPQVTRTGFTLVEWGGCAIPYKVLP